MKADIVCVVFAFLCWGVVCVLSRSEVINVASEGVTFGLYYSEKWAARRI
jgi:hypothetical protein